MVRKLNKKAQDLSIGTLILIVLGIIVLVLLILGFSIGWGNLWEKINIFGGTSSVGDVVTACNLAVTSNNPYDYCQNFRQVKINGNTAYVNCEYTDIQNQLPSKIDCSAQARPNNENSWADWYCAKVQTKLTKNTEVNNLNCAPNSPVTAKCVQPNNFVTTLKKCNEISPISQVLSCAALGCDLVDATGKCTGNGNVKCDGITGANVNTYCASFGCKVLNQ